MGWLGKHRKPTREDDYVRGEELNFKLLARRDQLMAAWAADLLDLQGPASADYIEAVIHFCVATPGDEALVAKFRTDFDAKGLRVTNYKIRKTLQSYALKVRAEISIRSFSRESSRE